MYVHLFNRPKHPLKVHVWAGISTQGRTPICIFEGIMDRFLYTSILQGSLLPFIDEVYPESHRFMQDNDPKHTSKYAADFMKENNVNWWKTPAESLDLNPIESLWHEVRVHMQVHVHVHVNMHVFTYFYCLQ